MINQILIGKNMKVLISLILVFIAAMGCFAQNPQDVLSKDHSIDSAKVIVPDETYRRVNQIINQFLSNYHYRKQTLNDSLSSEIFDQYIKSLDNNKLYFLKEDINSFEAYRYVLDENIKNGDLTPPFEMFNTYKQRLGERIEFVKKCLEQEFDFSINEHFEPNREKTEWAINKDELNELWRLRLKNDVLNLTLTGKDWKEASEILLKRYQNFHKIILQYEAEDVFALYINSYTQIYDPHTDYFSPAASENFNIAMRLSLEGIGATLRSENDYTIVQSIVAGGPAGKSGLLSAEDKIVAVAQGEDGEMVDIIGWRLDDAIQLIRGKKGSLVRLQILKAKDGVNALPVEISLIRDEVKLEEQAAKGEIIDIKEDGYSFKLGVVKLPSFYTDFEAQQKGVKDFRSTTRDVKEILKNFKNDKVDGVIIDLRNNGGGSLQEAITLTGLFIKNGPVVQVKNTANMIEINQDPDPDIFYDGPMAVLINRFSASASEIFSGAIQDYGRGIILGENTYGKGTVQNLIDLNRSIMIPNKKLGQLKLTVAKFYRISGSSTQNKGVMPDITFPSLYAAEEFGESAKPSALPWDSIQTAPHNKYGNISKFLPELFKRHNERIKKDPEYQLLMDDIAEFKENRERKSFTLNKEQRKEEREKAEERKKRREEERQKITSIKIEEKGETGTASTSVSDYELKESGRILANLIMAKIG